ncbi:hypothetical protein Agub_g6160 [Astrephomene gubernaculifera]|uniref:Biotin-protein ligase N-terminal domain-containing protein n=1 Tax=Astrephomene gubernaculifera TaxID=47775 RepID=A0AAD3DQ00_9CHLO|nr:hypothetical protein Agub_g6160 [Astrephomene gubernaculifera]
MSWSAQHRARLGLYSHSTVCRVVSWGTKPLRPCRLRVWSMASLTLACSSASPSRAGAPSQVLVYCGEGAGHQSARNTLHALKRCLAPGVEARFLDTEELLEGRWRGSCLLLVMPGGADLPYCRRLNGRGNQLLRAYVEAGGSYLGLCAGAYYACGRVEFEVGGPLQVVGDRELAFFPGTARGAAYPGFDYTSELGAHAAPLRFRPPKLPPPPPAPSPSPCTPSFTTPSQAQHPHHPCQPQQQQTCQQQQPPKQQPPPHAQSIPMPDHKGGPLPLPCHQHHLHHHQQHHLHRPISLQLQQRPEEELSVAACPLRVPRLAPDHLHFGDAAAAAVAGGPHASRPDSTSPAAACGHVGSSPSGTCNRGSPPGNALLDDAPGPRGQADAGLRRVAGLATAAGGEGVASSGSSTGEGWCNGALRGSDVGGVRSNLFNGGCGKGHAKEEVAGVDTDAGRWVFCRDYSNGGPVFQLASDIPVATAATATAGASSTAAEAEAALGHGTDDAHAVAAAASSSSAATASSSPAAPAAAPVVGAVEVLAVYPDLGNAMAAVRCRVGRGVAVLCGTHPEMPYESLLNAVLPYDARQARHVAALGSELAAWERQRRQFWMALLLACCTSSAAADDDDPGLPAAAAAGAAASSSSLALFGGVLSAAGVSCDASRNVEAVKAVGVAVERR